MSELENNPFPLPSPPSSLVLPMNTALLATSTSSSLHSIAQNYARDSKFYYHDGNTVFLAGGMLFKFQASLLAADPDIEAYAFKHLMKSATEGFQGDTSKPGANDAHPIVLPEDVTPIIFRDLLMVAFGGVTNKDLFDLLKSLHTPSDYSLALVSRLVKIGHLACRFGMKQLDSWSQAQIYTILLEFTVAHRLTDNWDAEAILRLVQYMQDTAVIDYRPKLLALMYHIISALVKEAYELNGEIPQGEIIDACVALYKAKDRLINSPGFFGFIFAVIVSLGHQSPIWADCLTREDRRVLYAASTTFTRLSTHADLKLDWVVDPTPVKKVCSRCSSNFDTSWKNAFSQCKGLKSRVPSEDIRHIVALPEYRLRFWSAFKNAPCQCTTMVVTDIGKRVWSLYCSLTEKYKFLVETV